MRGAGPVSEPEDPTQKLFGLWSDAAKSSLEAAHRQPLEVTLPFVDRVTKRR